MNRTPQEIIDWLIEHCDRDRVMRNALCNHDREPGATFYDGGWVVYATSCNGGKYAAFVYTNPIGEPMSWHRL